MANSVQRLMAAYPRIYFACHRRHVVDARNRQVISAHQASILDHLDAVEATTLSGLAGHMGVTSSTMSIAIDRLERQGYVERTRDDADKRRVGIRLTNAGSRIKSASSVLDPELVSTLLSHVSKNDLERALEGLESLADAANRMVRASTKAESRKQSA